MTPFLIGAQSLMLSLNEAFLIGAQSLMLSLNDAFLIGAQSLMLSLNDAFFDRCPVTDVVICYNFYKSVCPVLHLRRVLKKYI